MLNKSNGMLQLKKNKTNKIKYSESRKSRTQLHKKYKSYSRKQSNTDGAPTFTPLSSFLPKKDIKYRTENKSAFISRWLAICS